MNDPMRSLPRYFQKHFYLGVLILIFSVILKALLWLFGGGYEEDFFNGHINIVKWMH